MEMLMEFRATYRHGPHWFVDVYKEPDAERYWIFRSRDGLRGEQDTADALHPEPYRFMPTWKKAKWFYDHFGD
jgi:hypothetical protein